LGGKGVVTFGPKILIILGLPTTFAPSFDLPINFFAVTMTFSRPALAILALLLLPLLGFAQQQDSTQRITTFSGSVGITNNGFSIVPTFSLNSPATISLLSWRMKRFSIDPDVRLTLNAKKGGILLWARYYPIERKKFSLRVGAHPAFNLQTRDIPDGDKTINITQMRRFLAWEFTPNYRIRPNWSVGFYYLNGNALQKNGAQTIHFVNLNTAITARLGKSLHFTFVPAVFYLYLDGYEGEYFTAVGMLRHKKWPFSLQSSINKTLTSNIPGNKDFLWNVQVNYHFRKQFVEKKGSS
jgi:hypothetical protein